MDPRDRRLSLTIVTPNAIDDDLDGLNVKKDVDRGWAWVVLAAMFLSFFISCGLGYNVGIFFVSFLQAFNESKSYTAWIGAVYSAVFQIAGPISSLLLPYFGARQILLLGGSLLAISYALLFMANSVLYVMFVYGIIGGFGGLFAISGSVASVVQYFDHRLYMASGIMSSGAGVGIMAMGLLIEFTIEKYGWRGAILLMSGLSLQLCVCASLVYNNGRQLSNRKAKSRNIAVSKNLENGNANTVDQTASLNGDLVKKHHPASLNLFRDTKFWLLNGAIMSMNMATSSVYVFFKDILIHNGLGGSFKLFLTCIGITSTVGRGISGFLTNYIDPTLYYFIMGTVCAIDVFMLSVIHTEVSVIALASIFGLCHGVMAVLQTLKIAHVFGYDNMPIIWGYAMGFGSIGVLVGPPLGGYIADETGNYNGSIVLFSTVFFMSGLCSLLIYIIRRIELRSKSVTKVLDPLI